MTDHDVEHDAVDESEIDGNAVTSQPLGAIAIPTGTIEHDFAVSQIYQSYSAELLRLSLAGVAAVGFFITTLTSRNSVMYDSLGEISTQLRWTLGLFGGAAAAAVLHRYLSGDSLAHTLEALRLRRRNAPEDRLRLGRVVRIRNIEFKIAGLSLILSGCFLISGLVFLWIVFSRWLAGFGA